MRRPTAREKCRDWGFPHEDIAILFSLTRGHRRSGFSAAELNVSAMSLCADVYAGSGNVQGLSDCDGCVLAIIDEVLAE